MMDGINFIDHLLTLEREREGNFSFGGGGGIWGFLGALYSVGNLRCVHVCHLT